MFILLSPTETIMFVERINTFSHLSFSSFSKTFKQQVVVLDIMQRHTSVGDKIHHISYMSTSYVW